MKLSQALTEGGQTWAHRMRMMRQVLRMVLNISCICGTLFFVFSLIKTDKMLYRSAWYHAKGQFCHAIGHNKIRVDSLAWSQITGQTYASNVQLLDSTHVIKRTLPYYNSLGTLLLEKSKNALIFIFSLQGCLVLFFLLRGKSSKRKKHLSGQQLVPSWKISLGLKLKKQDSHFKIGTLPLIKNTETQHILVSGGTGSGKTNFFHHFLPQIRSQGQRAVVIDTTGIFVERYYREGKDIILNPCDPRSKPWHPWAECKDPFDYKALAESFIPQSYSEEDNYWRSAARIFFTALLQKNSDLKKASELTKWLLYSSLEEVSAFLQSTKAASVMDVQSERTASSIRTLATTFLECLELLKDTEHSFSIREWMQNENDDGWLFLCCSPMQRAELLPLLACWFSVATRSLLQMAPSFTRRIWFALDELASLNRLKNLENFVTESRKYGGCGLLALQSPSQLEAIYGDKIAEIIVGNCNTKIVFAEQDPKVAARISKFFGDREIQQVQEGISYGAHEIRDGVSLSAQNRNIPIVTPTDIQSLNKNTAFVKLSGNIPVAKVKLPIVI